MKSDIHFGEVSLSSCTSLVQTQHYLQRVPGAVKLCYAASHASPFKILACCIFSQLTGRLVVEEAWEVTRLVRLPECGAPLTRLLGKAVGYLRGNHKEVTLLLSFADSEEGHHGGVYQACSWVYDGMREERLDGFNIDGVFVAARTCNSTYGTSSVEGLQRKLKGRRVVPHYDSGKHCYWKALSKNGMHKAVEIGLRSAYYPKPLIERGGTLPPTNGQRKGKVVLPSRNVGAGGVAPEVLWGEDMLE